MHAHTGIPGVPAAAPFGRAMPIMISIAACTELYVRCGAIAHVAMRCVSCRVHVHVGMYMLSGEVHAHVVRECASSLHSSVSPVLFLLLSPQASSKTDAARHR